MKLGRWQCAAFVFTLVAVVVSSLANLSPAVAQQTPAPAMKQIAWRTSAAIAAGYVDSMTASINGALQTVDTTVAVSTADWDWTPPTDIPSTAFGCARIAFQSTNNTASDSLFYVQDNSLDGVNWSSSATFIGDVVGTSGDKVLGSMLTCDGDALGSLGAGKLYLWPYIRFRVRADGNTGALFAAAKMYLIYFKRAGSY